MLLKSINIGKLKTGNLFLAPMAEITNYPFRKILLENGCDFIISEMVSAKALSHRNKKSLQAIKIRDDKPIAIQLFGSDEITMLEAANLCVENDADMIEINAGCPVKKVIKTGAGVSLMKNPHILCKITETLASKLQIPVSVKIRIGLDEKHKTAITLSKDLENAGAGVIHIHLRTANQYHSGSIDFETAAKIKSIIKIPLIANGGINSVEKAIEMFEKTGCDAISIARAAISNPFIFSDIKEFLLKKEKTQVSLSKKISTFIRYLEISEQIFGERDALIKSRRLAGLWLSGFPNAAMTRAKFMKAKSITEAKKIISEINYEN